MCNKRYIKITCEVADGSWELEIKMLLSSQ